MRIGRVLGVAVALLVAVGVAFAADEAAKVAGTVKSVDAENNTLVVTVQKEGAEAADMTFAVTDETRIVAGEVAKTLADLQAGQKVVVRYTTADDKMTATMIHVMVPRKREQPKEQD